MRKFAAIGTNQMTFSHRGGSAVTVSNQGIRSEPIRMSSELKEFSNCGVGFVASTDLQRRHQHLAQGLKGLQNLEHRGGCLADGKTGDGAGIMTEIPFDLLGVKEGHTAVGMVFMLGDTQTRREALRVIHHTFQFMGLKVSGDRTVPIETKVLGSQARETLPTIIQFFIESPAFCHTLSAFEALLYQAKQALRTQLARANLKKTVYWASLSAKTIVYKSLTTAADLPKFYPDLGDTKYKTRFSLFHRRFSTNTITSWDKAQPFRMIAHNGEINTIECNRSWNFAREQALGLPRDELFTREDISDSGNLNEMVEALRVRSSIPHLSEILSIMVPPADAKSADFYRFWSRALEPWDGPAFLAFADGDVVGARLDRNGFRPCRWLQTVDTFYLASEAGIFEVEDELVQKKGALSGGEGVFVDLNHGEVRFEDPSQARENYQAHFDARLVEVTQKKEDSGRHVLDTPAVGLFPWSKEDLDSFLVPMARWGKEPIGSMGDTARPAFLSQERRPFFDFFYQTFAQVTNPPLDHLRERLVTDLRVYLGRRPNVFAPKTLLPLSPALELSSPVLTPQKLDSIRGMHRLQHRGRAFECSEISITFPRVKGETGLEKALEELKARVLSAIEGGCSIIILTDRKARNSRPPIPSLLALAAASEVLTLKGRRLDASLVVEAGDVTNSHQLAALVSFGAAAVCPYLAFEAVEESGHRLLTETSVNDRRTNLENALKNGLLKTMSKMGISTVSGYQGSKLFTTLGLSSEILDRYFGGVESKIQGLSLAHLARDILKYSSESETALKPLHVLRENAKGLGEAHSMTSRQSRLLYAVSDDQERTFSNWSKYQEYVQARQAHFPVNLRHLFSFREQESLSLEDVQSRREILRRFGSGSMSFGAISQEAQRDIIHAMKAIGGRSGSGEGGENPFYFIDGTTASSKQVASGRFGVTAQYLVAGEEIEIKIAQGAKPGEGGQLMAEKVDETIAKARYASAGVDLISPPPLHDIYSIEDLRELIYELKQLKPGIDVCVKLVSGVNIGAIAAGVVKAGADVILISGGDGGTGAASRTSMRHAGLPWEIGLWEVHRALTDQWLREHVRLRVDGGLSDGRDIVVGTLLGADEFNFGKLLMIAQGCIMARVCEKNTCPRGIATHDPKYKKKYIGTADQIATVMHYIAEDVRHHLAKLGFSRLEELVGRGDLLRVNPEQEERIRALEIDLEDFFSNQRASRSFIRPLLHEDTNLFNRRVLDLAAPAISGKKSIDIELEIKSTDRAAFSTLSGAIAESKNAKSIKVQCSGSAGQGFAAFLTGPVDISLYGEANDSVCKSMSSGRVAILPPKKRSFRAESSSIIGNCALYGATGGQLLVYGMAGDRFAVRNSGAVAIVEGVGLHACEYMTGGTVVILGETGPNIGAGMTGGTIYLRKDQTKHLNTEYVAWEQITVEDTKLSELLSNYAEITTRQMASEEFVRVVPLRLKTQSSKKEAVG